MGMIRMGAPMEILQFLQKEMSLKTFVEGGTFKGKTAIAASKIFDRVITIENSAEMHRIASENLRGHDRIRLLHGDTRQHLADIVRENDDLLYWLDAHWSGGATYGAGDECPLMDELEIVFSASNNHVILIDDARLFCAPPPLPHQIEHWPTLKEIANAIPPNWSWFCFDDVIAIIPDGTVKPFQQFLQQTITDRWQNASKPKSIVAKLLSSIAP